MVDQLAVSYNMDSVQLQLKLEKLKVDFNAFKVAVLNEVALLGKQTMMEEAPQGKTKAEGGKGAPGGLRNSIEEDIDDDSVKIYPTKEYAVFVELGTSPSPGRYVPAIGKRLVNPASGMHPGIPANPFVERTRAVVTGTIPIIVTEKINEHLGIYATGGY